MQKISLLFLLMKRLVIISVKLLNLLIIVNGYYCLLMLFVVFSLLVHLC